MKNTINYFYDLVANNIHQKNDVYRFDVNNDNYLFMPFYGDVNSVYRIYLYLIRINIYCHEIIHNKENKIITFINEKPYILLKIYINTSHLIKLYDIYSYNILIESDKQCNWYDLWCKKLDYYEYQVNQYGKKYPLIRESFSYYDGMCETAISLLKIVDLRNIGVYINHHRITKNTSLVDFYNPLNMIIDVKVRDVCEYFKKEFFEDRNPLNDINNYLLMANLTNDEAMLFFIRLVYPSYYFDLYDEIIQENQPENKLYYYINKVDKYENFLYDVYVLLKKMYTIPEIEWIIKT